MIRVILVIAILMSLSQPLFGQDKSVLINESGDSQCEFVWGALDLLRHEMAQNPTAVATIEIIGKENDISANFYLESMIRGYARKYLPADRWSVRRARWEGQRRFRYWLTPPGAKPPKIDDANWSFVYPANTKPFIFTHGESYMVEVGVCLEVDEIDLLAKALAANPKAGVNVVLIVRNGQQYQRRRRNILRNLSGRYSISPMRIRTFKKISRKPNPHRLNPDADYWFVP